MTDPKRLLEEGDLGATLLRSARGDAPTEASRVRAAAALGIAVGTAVVTTSATAGGAGAAAAGAGAGGGGGAAAAGAGVATAKAAVGGLGLKIVAAGVLATTVLGGAAIVSRSGEDHATRPPMPGASISVAAKSPRAPSTTPPSLAEASPVASANAAPPEPVGPSDTSTTLAVAAHAPDTVPSGLPKVPVAARAPAAASGESPLARELESLDRARTALGRADANGALGEIDRYDRAFPRGSLRTEAQVLRAEALLAKGDKTAARALARRLLERDPSGPHAKRLRTIAGDDP